VIENDFESKLKIKKSISNHDFKSFDFKSYPTLRTETSHLSTLSKRIILLFLYADYQGSKTAAIARHVSFS